MTIVLIIFGVLLIACGFSCMFTPLITFIDAGYFIVILVSVYGVMGIVKAITKKEFGVGFVFSIISVIFGITTLFFPGLMTLADGVLIYMAAAWFVIQGIVSIYTSFAVKKATGSKMWILQLIVGILGVLLGCYSFFHPLLVVVSIGILIGIFFIECGISMIAAASKTE